MAKWGNDYKKKYVVEGLAMPYDKETRDALQAYYETHDFTGNIPAIDDKKIRPHNCRFMPRRKSFLRSHG